MPTLKYWDPTANDYLPLPGTPGPTGPTGPAGPAGPTGPQGPAGGITGDVLLITLPVGAVVSWAGATLPTGYMECNGAAVSRATYSELYTALGGASSPWGQGDGSTTFNLPDLRDRAPVGVSATKALGSVGGSATKTIAVTNMPAHSHGVTDPGHQHDAQKVSTQVFAGGSIFGDRTQALAQLTGAQYTGISINNTGGGTPLDVLNPYAALRYIIRTITSTGSGGAGSSGLPVSSPALTAGTWVTVTHGLGLTARDVSFTVNATGDARNLDWRIKAAAATTAIEVRSGVDRAADYYTIYVEA